MQIPRHFYQQTPAQRVELQVATYLFRLRLKLRREARDAGKAVRA